ncbi:putative motility protein [Halobacillus litoralis]|uniref:Putative motility protein n=1 Tax=Halobacillus litoralis TaxID=45668 RepID=A0A845E1R0_9BACI|nr:MULTISPECIES: YjfB family protein [Halobacillus]MCA1020941.1 YjfB family protein [Halobacillus litoralis]MYL20227.1 putative motility protein [Halobacillus litoralis]MYL29321.1 putative motility protein [Halobacillus halophilus]MYL36538.1 putative motility protein [Halobacillus litoralis]
MDAAALSMALGQTQLKQQTNLALMDKVKDEAEAKGNQMVEMLNQSVSHPDLGNHVDLRG